MIGEPHRRWRETHHSNRFSTIPAMRASPQGGTHVAFAISASERARRSSRACGAASWVRAMKYCSVARKITGFLQRQQCG